MATMTMTNQLTGSTITDGSTISLGSGEVLQLKVSASSTSEPSFSWSIPSSSDFSANLLSFSYTNDFCIITISSSASSSSYAIVCSLDGQPNSMTIYINIGGSTTATPSSISINATSLSLNVGETHQLSATVTMSDGSTNSNVEWAVPPASSVIISVSDDGLVTALSDGTGTVIVYPVGDLTGIAAYCSVTVTETPSSISINETSLSLKVGETYQLTATVTMTNGGTNNNVSWEEDSGGNVISIDSTGLVTAISPGTANVTAIANANTSITARCSIEVVGTSEEETVTSVSVTNISGTEAEIKIGDSLELTVYAFPTTLSNRSVTLSLAGNTVSCSTSTGNVFEIVGKSEGWTYLTFTSVLDPTVSTTIAIKVIANSSETVESIVPNVLHEFTLAVGSEFTFTGTVYPETASNRNVTFGLDNSSSAIAIVNTDSTSIRVLGASAGTAMIYMYAEANTNIYAYVRIDVIEITSTTPSFNHTSVEGAAYGFSLNSNGYLESQNKGVNNTAALCAVTLILPSSYKVTVDCICSSENYYDYGILSKIGYILDPSLINDGDTGVGAVQKNFKGESSTSVQTVDYGTLGSGTHFFYAKFLKDSTAADGNDSLQFIVHFEKASETKKVTSITLEASNYNIEVGSKTGITISILPEDAADKSVTWSSSDTEVATISTSGDVTGVHRGLVTITASANDGGGCVATANFIIKPACYIYNGIWKKASAHIYNDNWIHSFVDVHPFITGETGFQGSEIIQQS